MTAPRWWPTAPQRSLLRACLATDDDLATRLREWEESVELDEVDEASVVLLPYLYSRLRLTGIEPRDAGRLKGIYARQWYIASRDRRGWEHLPSGFGAVALSGPVVARTAYRAHVDARPADDSALLVRPSVLAAVTEALEARGYERASTPSTEQAIFAGWPIRLTADGAGVSVRTRFASYSADPGVDERVRATADGMVASRSAQFLDALQRGARGNDLRWLLDAALLSSLLSDAEWVIVVNDIGRCGWRDPSAMQLRYLRDALDVPIPVVVVSQVGALPRQPAGALANWARARQHDWSQRLARLAVGGYLDAPDRPRGLAGAVAYPVGNLRRVVEAGRLHSR